MRNIKQRGATLSLGLSMCAVVGVTWMAPAQAQSMQDEASAAAPPCRNIVGQAEIDGTMQQIGGLACQQPDGTWQIMQSDDNAVALYPAFVYPYYDPWYWGGFVTVVGGSFVFIDRFHHHFHMGHVHFGHGPYGGWGHGGTWQTNAVTGGMHGGFGMMHGGGGRR